MRLIPTVCFGVLLCCVQAFELTASAADEFWRQHASGSLVSARQGCYMIEESDAITPAIICPSMPNHPPRKD